MIESQRPNWTRQVQLIIWTRLVQLIQLFLFRENAIYSTIWIWDFGCSDQFSWFNSQDLSYLYPGLPIQTLYSFLPTNLEVLNEFALPLFYSDILIFFCGPETDLTSSGHLLLHFLFKIWVKSRSCGHALELNAWISKHLLAWFHITYLLFKFCVLIQKFYPLTPFPGMQNFELLILKPLIF